MIRPAATILLCLAGLLSACVDQNTQIPLNKVDQSGYVGAPGNTAP